MLLQGQDDAVGDDGGEDHVLERSGRLKLRDLTDPKADMQCFLTPKLDIYDINTFLPLFTYISPISALPP